MGSVVKLALFFLLSLSFSVGLFTFLADSKATGGGFLKMVASVCGGASFLYLGLHLAYFDFKSLQTLLVAIATVSFLLIYLFHEDEKSLLMRLLFIIHNLCLSLAMFNFFQGNWSHFLFAFSSSILLGSITYAMVMGHWYLVTPRLSEKPLLYAMYFTWASLVVKVIWTATSYNALSDYFAPGTTLGAGYLFNWVMLTMRVGWGYIVIGAMSYFGYRLIAMRSTQSATGMLYAMTFFVFVSELVSMYMMLEYKMFL